VRSIKRVAQPWGQSTSVPRAPPARKKWDVSEPWLRDLAPKDDLPKVDMVERFPSTTILSPWKNRRCDANQTIQESRPATAGARRAAPPAAVPDLHPRKFPPSLSLSLSFVRVSWLSVRVPGLSPSGPNASGLCRGARPAAKQQLPQWMSPVSQTNIVLRFQQGRLRSRSVWPGGARSIEAAAGVLPRYQASAADLEMWLVVITA